jgi:hypothetical protein
MGQLVNNLPSTPHEDYAEHKVNEFCHPTGVTAHDFKISHRKKLGISTAILCILRSPQLSNQEANEG